MNLTNEEYKQLEEATSENWNSLILEMKKKRNGQYPPDWGVRILLNPNFKNKKMISFDATIF